VSLLFVVPSPNWSFSLVLKQDGSLWATGQNDKGQFGDGTTNNRDTFGKVIPSDFGVQFVIAGSHNIVVIKQDGSLVATGSNEFGQLGLGKNTQVVNEFAKVTTLWTPTNPAKTSTTVPPLSTGAVAAVVVVVTILLIAAATVVVVIVLRKKLAKGNVSIHPEATAVKKHPDVTAVDTAVKKHRDDTTVQEDPDDMVRVPPDTSGVEEYADATTVEQQTSS
jgi:alpha-tubulin suppressor-like RCC1 family protein